MTEVNTTLDPHLVWTNLLGGDVDEARFNWQPLQPGVDLCRLYQDPASPRSAGLLRYQPGASVPRHLHVGFEYLFVLRGSQYDERATYSQGTFVINPPETSHWVASEEGCLMLAIWEKPVQFI